MIVSYCVVWFDGVTAITDEFLWPKSRRDVKAMRVFAIDYLSDLFGADNMRRFAPE